jgi:hypothetical protein
MKEWNEDLPSSYEFKQSDIVSMVIRVVFHNAIEDELSERTDRFIKALDALGFEVKRGKVFLDETGLVFSEWSFRFKY